MKLYTYKLLISWFGVQVTDDPPEEIKGLQILSVSPFWLRKPPARRGVQKSF